MARILRVSITLADYAGNPNSLEMRIEETLRTAQTRTIAAVQCGSHIREEDLEVTLQILEDTIRSAVGRTLGISERLPF